jgi:hypothetical protein
MSLFLLVFLSACATPEEKAAEVALAYQSAGVDVARSYPLVCEKDKATKSLTDRTAELTAASAAAGVLGEAAGKLLEMAANSTYTVDSTIVTPDGGSATVTLVMTYEGEEVNRPTVELQATEDGWCVVTGWAEKKRIEEEKARVQAELVKVDEALAEALEAYEAWDFDETEALLKRGLELLDSLPEEHLGYSGEQVRKSITELQELLEERRSQHVAGRWLAKVTTDPMTDDTNVLAYMESLDGMPNAIGDLKKVTLIARCQEGAYEVYLSTDSMLDSHWRYKSVSGRQRFDKDPAEPFVGNRSSDFQAMFPYDSQALSRRLMENDGRTWTVELPVSRGGSYAVSFDLTGSKEALTKAMGACGL